MPEHNQFSSALPRESQRWLSPQLAYTEIFHMAISDGREQRAAAAIAAHLFSSYLVFSLIEHAHFVHKCVLEHFPVPEPASRPDEPAVVNVLVTCLIRWQNEVEDMAHPTEEEVAAVSKELTILALSLLHPTWVMEVPNPLRPASAADEEAEILLAAIGYSRERLCLALEENALGVTQARLYELVHRLASAVQQVVDEELTEALHNLSYPRRLTKRQARVLRDQIAKEIDEDNMLRQYFTYCCGIEVESIAGGSEYQIHLFFEAYGRHYGEMWVRDEKTWRKEAAKIREEVKEEER